MMMKDRFLFTLLSLLLICACKASTVKDTKIKKEEPKFEFHCNYILNNKYKADQDPVSAKAWIENLHQNRNFEENRDLFSHDGGGPCGAEWNSDGDIYISALIWAKDIELRSVSLKMNNSVIRNGFRIERSDTSLFLGVRIDSNVWQSQLKEIKKKSYPLLYSSTQIEQGKSSSNSGIGQGKKVAFKLKLKISGKNFKVKRAFAWENGF